MPEKIEIGNDHSAGSTKQMPNLREMGGISSQQGQGMSQAEWDDLMTRFDNAALSEEKRRKGSRESVVEGMISDRDQPAPPSPENIIIEEARMLNKQDSQNDQKPSIVDVELDEDGAEFLEKKALKEMINRLMEDDDLWSKEAKEAKEVGDRGTMMEWIREGKDSVMVPHNTIADLKGSLSEFLSEKGLRMFAECEVVKNLFHELSQDKEKFFLQFARTLNDNAYKASIADIQNEPFSRIKEVLSDSLTEDGKKLLEKYEGELERVFRVSSSKATLPQEKQISQPIAINPDREKISKAEGEEVAGMINRLMFEDDLWSSQEKMRKIVRSGRMSQQSTVVGLENLVSESLSEKGKQMFFNAKEKLKKISQDSHSKTEDDSLKLNERPVEFPDQKLSPIRIPRIAELSEDSLNKGDSITIPDQSIPPRLSETALRIPIIPPGEGFPVQPEAPVSTTRDNQTLQGQDQGPNREDKLDNLVVLPLPESTEKDRESLKRAENERTQNTVATILYWLITDQRVWMGFIDTSHHQDFYSANPKTRLDYILDRLQGLHGKAQILPALNSIGDVMARHASERLTAIKEDFIFENPAHTQIFVRGVEKKVREKLRSASEAGAIPEPSLVLKMQEASSGVFNRMKSWISGARERVVESDAYRVHVKGEYVKSENTESRMAFLRKCVGTTIFQGVGTALGVKFFADLPRFLTQMHYTKQEREDILRVLEGRADVESNDVEGKKVKELEDRFSAMEARIKSSRYLQENKKREILERLGHQRSEAIRDLEDRERAYQAEVARILDHEIRTRVSGEQVIKQGVNTLITWAIPGYTALRTPAYGALALAYRYQKARKQEKFDKKEISRMGTLRSAIIEGFTSFSADIKGRNGRISQVVAFQKFARFAGIVLPSILDKSATEDLDDGIARVVATLESKLSDVKNGIEHAYKEMRDSFSQDADTVPIVEPQDPTDYEPKEYQSGDSVEPEVESSSESGESDSGPYAAEVTTPNEPSPDPVHGLDGAEVVNIPDEYVVDSGDGITQVLGRTLNDMRESLNSDEQRALSNGYNSARLLRSIAQRDGLLNSWFSSKAIDNIAVIPERDSEGDLHITFFDKFTREKISLEDMRKMGYIEPAPDAE